MKTTTAALLLALSVTGANAFADTSAVTDANYPGPFSLESNTTHAQVQTELARARAAGAVYNNDAYPGPFASTGSVSRDTVRAELAQARAEGWAFNDATFPTPSRTVPRHRANPSESHLAASGHADVVTR